MAQINLHTFGLAANLYLPQAYCKKCECSALNLFILNHNDSCILLKSIKKQYIK